MRAGISANDLMFRLRGHGIYEVAKVKSGILEQNGQLVIIENDEANVRFPLINDGQINIDVMELIHHDEQWVFEQIHKAGYDSVEAADEAGVAFVFMGHGTSHAAKVTYSQMQTGVFFLKPIIIHW